MEVEKTAIILAGGLGSRLKAEVPDCPKPLAPVAGRPFLAYILCQLQQSGFRHVRLSVGYMAQQIMDYCGDYFEGLSISYAVEERPLGTGGAIVYASEGLPENQPIWVLNGDTYFDINFPGMEQFYADQAADIVIALKYMEHFERYGAVELDSELRIKAFGEKTLREQGWINGGIYLFRPGLLHQYPSGTAFSFEQAFLEAHIESIRTFGFCSTGYFIDIGVPEDYRKAEADFKRGAPILKR